LVSRALNDKGGVSKMRREKVLQAAALLEYSPNVFAKSLVAQKSIIIGIVIPQRLEYAFANPFFPQVIRGIGDIATEYQYHLLIAFCGGPKNGQPFYKTNLASGFIILGNLLDDPDIYELERRNIPAVLIPGLLRDSPLPSVDTDDVNAGYQVTKHLLDLGHRKIALLNGTRNSKYSVQRLLGYQKAFQEYRLFYDEDLLVESEFSEVGGFQKMTELLERQVFPTAVICASDVMAIGAFSAIKEKKLRIPDHISVASFGDIPLAGMLGTPLTTVQIPFMEIGQLAFKTLISLIKGDTLQKKDIVIPVKLILRQSTKEVSKR
jgi:DNA-binding LacI/PurR family transcriptional regulator